MSHAVHTEPPRRRKTAAAVSPPPSISCRTRALAIYSSVQPSPYKRMSQESFDQTYIDALVAGQPNVQAHFTRYFGDLLFIKVRGSVRSVQLREDIVQETFLRAIKYLKNGQLDHPERLGAFMCRVCDNITKEQFRKLSRDFALPEGQPGDPPDESTGSEERLVTDERKRHVRKLLDEMPERDSRLLRAIFIDDRDKDEVCREFQVDRNYLRVLLHRAKSKFRESLERGGSALLAALMPC
jgi:RNA polymerase sigma-70 factor, ECF subfamily